MEQFGERFLGVGLVTDDLRAGASVDVVVTKQYGQLIIRPHRYGQHQIGPSTDPFDSDQCIRVDHGNSTTTAIHPDESAAESVARVSRAIINWINVGTTSDYIHRTLSGRFIGHDRGDLVHPYTD